MTRATVSEHAGAREHARALLRSLRGEPAVPTRAATPAVLPGCASGALMAMRTLMGRDPFPAARGADRLTERAELLALPAPGRVSANGGCHLLPARDGWLALNLARDEDWSLLPAWLEYQRRLPDLKAVARQVERRATAPLLSRGQLMGLPVSVVQPPAPPASWFRLRHTSATPNPDRSRKPPLVVDLSSLWAGPLCAHLLAACGARVVKVESRHRPDSTRTAAPAFFRRLNHNKQALILDFRSAEGVRRLRQLLAAADVVIEASRPRALAQLGIDVEALLQARPGKLWLGITAYGRSPPMGDWVGFGDDVAVAAGAVRAGPNGPAFYGDAVADPLTGLHAALAALYYVQNGLGGLLDVSLYGVTAWCLTRGGHPDPCDSEAEAFHDHGASRPSCC